MATEGTPISGMSLLNSLAGEVYVEAIRRANSGDAFKNVRLPVDLLKGQAGSDGTDGMSTYELAVSEGYGGSLSQWLMEQKGAKGDQGDPGTDGIDGTDGTDGADGESAYELAVRLGDYTGDEAGFVAWLRQGTDLSDVYERIDALESAGSTGSSIGDQLGLAESQWKPPLLDYLDAVNNADRDGFLYYEAGSLAIRQGTKALVGLDQVNNTADADKPISNATAAALANKINQAQLDAAVAGMLNVNDVVDDLLSTATDKPLSANQGRLLKQSFDTLADVFGDQASIDEIVAAVQYILDNREALDNLQIANVAGLQAALDSINTTLGGHTTRLDTLESQIGELAAIKAAQATLETTAQDHTSRLVALEDAPSTDSWDEPRVKAIEDRLVVLEAVEIPDLEPELQSIRDRLTTLESASGGDGGTGTDHSAEITAIEERLDAIELALGNKVDAEAGKGLSSNDYTDEHRDAVADLIANPPAGGTTYTHPTGFESNSVAGLTGNQVISGVTLNTEGHVTAIETRELTAADIGAAAEGSSGGDTGGEPSTGGGTFVRKRISIMRGSLEAIIIIVGFGNQTDMDQVTATEFDSGSRVQIDNKPEGLVLYSVSLYYDDGWNEGTSFRLEYPDNWGDTFMGDMVLPTMVYYLRSNPPTIQALVNISYGHENGFNSVTKVNITAGRGYHWRYSFV